MTNLTEAFSSSESRVGKVIMYIDLTGSTKMKETEDEAAWLSRYAWFFDEVNKIVHEAGTIVKYLGDGVMAAYDEEYAAEAINAAIKLQESVSDNHRKVRLSCSVGITTGEVVCFEDPRGQEDYIGLVADKAARLCDIASPKAIFVGDDTLATAQMRRVFSKIGDVLKRGTNDYSGDAEKIDVTGFGSPVKYHEILWDQTRFGVKSKALGDKVDADRQRPVSISAATTPRPDTSAGTAVTTPRPDTSAGTAALRAAKATGTVKYWSTDKRYGKIITPDGLEYYVDNRYTVSTSPLVQGSKVWFVPGPSAGEGLSPLATCVLTIGEKVVGMLRHAPAGKPFAFFQVTDTSNNVQDVFWYHGGGELGVSVGERRILSITESNSGPSVETIAESQDSPEVFGVTPSQS